MEPVTLKTKDMTVEFPGVRALDRVCFQVQTGEIHALLGANGAGKSTLVKALAGINPSYKGEIRIGDRTVELRTPLAAKKLGIQMVYQEVDTALVPSLSVAENILLDDLALRGKGGPLVRWNRIYEEAGQILRRLNVDLDGKRKAGELSLAQKQMILIARALRRSCRFLLLDEPTAPLSSQETEVLFQICRRLVKSEQIAIVFISHRLSEILSICDSYTVMRNGAVVERAPVTPRTTTGEIVEKMLGRQLELTGRRRTRPQKEVLLEAEHLSNADGSIEDVSVSVYGGEVVGIAGLVGAGKSELCKTLFGAMKKNSGAIRLRGRQIELSSPFDAVRSKIGLIPEERRKEGILPSESVAFNLAAASLKEMSRADLVSAKKIACNASRCIRMLKIKTPSIYQPVELLSGGNQQKIVVGKWLAADCDIYLFDEPTKGIDIGAKAEMLRLIDALADRGCGVLYTSCENEELLSVTDRIYVLFDGRIAAELITAETSEEEIMYYASGGREPFGKKK